MKTTVLAVTLLFLFGNAAIAEVKQSDRRSKNMKNEAATKKTNPSPIAGKFTASPLRNRIRFEVNSPVSKVWELLGDLTRFPEYSAGLARVEVKKDSAGKPSEYVCHFKPQKEGEEGIISREKIRWFETNRGYASSGAQADAFGLKDDLHLVTLEKSEKGTVLTWDEYYDAQDLPMMKEHFNQALEDAAKNLVERFGGKILERYIEER